MSPSNQAATDRYPQSHGWRRAFACTYSRRIRGDRNKWERAVAYDAVVTDPGETHRHFVQRARASMMHMRAWEYRNRNHPGNRPDR